jgi:hypothetical protein
MSAVHDWSGPRSCEQYVGFVSAQNPPGLVVRLATHGPIPTTAADQAELKAKRIVGTILAFPKLGFVSAPYTKKAKPGKEPPAPPRRLLEPDSTHRSGEVISVKVFGFHKVSSNFDKGQRDDGCVSTLRLGQTLTFYLNDFLYDTSEKKTVFPEGCPGVIPAYSVVEVHLNPSHNQSKGYGLKIARIAPVPHTLYSYASSQGFQALARTPEEASQFVKDCAAQCESVQNQVEQSRFSFVAEVDRTARVVDVREDLPYLRIECPEGSSATPVPGVHSLDVPLAALQSFTNFPGDVVGARTLVDLAIAAGALRVFAVFDDYHNHKEPALGQYRCVPLVNTRVLLAAVQERGLETTESSVVFPVDWGLHHEPTLRSLALRVSTVPVGQEEGEAPHDDAFDVTACVAPPTPDLVLVSPACAFTRGYRVLVGNPGSAAERANYIMACYFDASPKGSGFSLGCGGGPGRVTGYKRVRFSDEENDE